MLERGTNNYGNLGPHSGHKADSCHEYELITLILAKIETELHCEVER